VRRQWRDALARRQAAATPPADWGVRHLEGVRRSWTDAVADVPYYASLVAAGEAPAHIATWDDFRRIPPLTREILQRRQAEFIRRSAPPPSTVTTAGSTGTPLKIGVSAAERDLMRVVKLAEWMALGYEPGSRLFLIWGHGHLLGTGWRGRLNHLRRKSADRFLGYRRVDAYLLTPALCDDHANALLRFRPAGVIGYASALDLFARYAAAHRDRIRAIGVRFVLATAEAPPRPDTVALIEDLFGCPVVQEYGGAEFGQVAFKTGPAPFQVYSDLSYVECEPQEDPASAGEPILVTSLYPRYLPLIRYRVGDTVVAPERQPHGHVVRFREVGGRLNDVIVLANGAAIHSVAIFHCIHQEAAVFNIQMILRDAETEIRLVAPDANRAEMEARIRARLAQVHPSLANVRFTYVEDLQVSLAGKRRWFIDNRTSSPCVASPAS
jgi:phenylacetate-coenzyme A ligase PaaK-like adenylate-forming protein